MNFVLMRYNIKNIRADIKIKNKEKCTAKYEKQKFFTASFKVFHHMSRKEKNYTVIVYLQCCNNQNSTHKLCYDKTPLVLYLILQYDRRQRGSKKDKGSGQFSQYRKYFNSSIIRGMAISSCPAEFSLSTISKFPFSIIVFTKPSTRSFEDLVVGCSKIKTFLSMM